MEILNVIGSIILVILFFSLIIKIVLWVFQAIGLQKIGNKNNINNSWVAWLPIGDLWVLGKISDTRKTFWKIKNTGKTFVILSIFQIVSMFFFIVGIASTVFLDILYEESIILSIFYEFIDLIYFLFGTSGALIILLKIWSLYNIYGKYKKDNVVLFLVLSVLFQFLIPIFIFMIRNNEEIQEVNEVKNDDCVIKKSN